MEQNVFTIFTGDDKTINLKANYEESGDPLDLTSCTEINIALPLSSGLFSHRLLSLGQVTITTPTLLGKFSCPIPNAISTALNVGELQNIDVTFTIAAKSFTVRFFQALSVFERN